MGNYVLETILPVAGVFLFFIFLSEDFQQWLLRLQNELHRRPRLKIVAYPLGALLILGASALIIRVLRILLASPFSYD